MKINFFNRVKLAVKKTLAWKTVKKTDVWYYMENSINDQRIAVHRSTKRTEALNLSFMRHGDMVLKNGRITFFEMYAALTPWAEWRE